ncbi:hypothetical protein G9A89_004511 [Geosiphon pyriformis]|nr:hypothetical protein G9A89_004511 [Geosiphon pyriformis]
MIGKSIQKSQLQISDPKSTAKSRSISTYLPATDAAANLSTTNISDSNLSAAATKVPLFSRAAFEEKPITVMYTNAKVDGQFIKLILDSGSAGSIITQQLMDQLDHQVDCTVSAHIITANGTTKTPIVSIVTRNCRQWVLVVMTMKNTLWQPNSTTTHVLLNTLEDQNEGETCDKLCQYMILISNWVKKETSIDTTWRQAVKRLDQCLHNDDKIWQMILAKIKGASPEEIKTIKDNLPEPIELD